jgi:hypothetical protein
MSGSNSSFPAASSARTDTVDEPLTLTVHSLPTAGDTEAKRALSGRWKMLAVMLACAAPVLLSYFTYYVLRPEGRKNYGELIEPTRPLPYVTAQRLDGTNVPLPSLQGQWLLVSVGGGACDAACEKRIYWTRQLREVMGRDKDRIDRIWLVADDAPVNAQLAAQAHAPKVDAQALRVSRAELEKWLQPAPGSKLEDHLYVVDPYGNWMLRWPANIDPSKAKRDIHNLLRASGSWDQAGRVGVMFMPAPMPASIPSTTASQAQPGAKP